MIPLFFHLVFHSDPKVKRNFCRKCSTAFTPNQSCDIEIVQARSSKEFPYVNCVCKTCGTTRKYILNPSHKLWETNPEFILKIYEELRTTSSGNEMEVQVETSCYRGNINVGSVPSSSVTDNDLLVSVPS